MSTNVHLTPELERFAKACVAGGRFNNVSEVVRAGLRMLQEAEERRAAFGRMLDEVRAEVAREGTFTVEEVMAEVDAIIDEEEERGAAAWRP
jgi:antitoxin ParD1/3/4